MNKYEKAIEAIGKRHLSKRLINQTTIGSIMVPYDSDQMISIWGFGAKLVETGKISHCFPLTFNSESDEVKGLYSDSDHSEAECFYGRGQWYARRLS